MPNAVLNFDRKFSRATAAAESCLAALRMTGVCAWTFVVLNTNPNASVSFSKTSRRIGSFPGSTISVTRGIGTSFTGEGLLDRRQSVQQDFADDAQAVG